jgi:two-component system response regulator CpxR
MSVITVFSGTYCNKAIIIKKILDETGYKLITDDDIAAEASKISGIADNKIKGALAAKTSVFNQFTHEKERSIAFMRLSLARMISKDNLLISGFSAQLIPKEISHVLRVCLIADMKFRTSIAVKKQDLSEKDAVNLIRKQDTEQTQWVNSLFKNKDPWDASLYDIVIPTDKTQVEEAVDIIKENLSSEVIKPTSSSKKAASDFILSSEVEVALAGEGHNVGVSARDGCVTLTINKQVLMIGRLEEELKSIASKISGVTSVETRVGKGFYKTDIYRKYDFEVPSKVLLVDDEREFVQTLSERLVMRDVGSAVAFDGESAINMVNEEEPEVMILDLKMPGIDGFEVLRKVKKTNPEIEVIILTGHGSEADKEECMSLGAFAYLQKPVDIDVLSKTLKKANEKMRQDLAKRK